MGDKALRGNKLTRIKRGEGGNISLSSLKKRYGSKKNYDKWKKTPKGIKEIKRLEIKFPNLYKDPK